FRQHQPSQAILSLIRRELGGSGLWVVYGRVVNWCWKLFYDGFHRRLCVSFRVGDLWCRQCNARMPEKTARVMHGVRTRCRGDHVGLGRVHVEEERRRCGHDGGVAGTDGTRGTDLGSQRTSDMSFSYCDHCYFALLHNLSLFHGYLPLSSILTNEYTTYILFV
ncbi:unnamed protein product, partial [Ixodes pacificus]